MIDPISTAMTAVAAHAAAAPALVCAAGALSSAGPCAAPRLIAISGVVARAESKQRLFLAAVFTAGLVLAYASFGAAASMIGRMFAFSPVTYAMLAAVLTAAGVATLWKGDRECKLERKDFTHGAGAVFLLGASFALIVSPCCTPIVTAIVAYTTAAGDPLNGSVLLGCYALGHALPILITTGGTSRVADLLHRFSAGGAAATVSGALMMALGLYYGALA